jgi:hypothetical protein
MIRLASFQILSHLQQRGIPYCNDNQHLFRGNAIEASCTRMVMPQGELGHDIRTCDFCKALYSCMGGPVAHLKGFLVLELPTLPQQGTKAEAQSSA